jgi:hypothetical protein
MPPPPAEARELEGRRQLPSSLREENEAGAVEIEPTRSSAAIAINAPPDQLDAALRKAEAFIMAPRGRFFERRVPPDVSRRWASQNSGSVGQLVMPKRLSGRRGAQPDERAAPRAQSRPGRPGDRHGLRAPSRESGGGEAPDDEEEEAGRGRG